VVRHGPSLISLTLNQRHEKANGDPMQIPKSAGTNWKSALYSAGTAC